MNEDLRPVGSDSVRDHLAYALRHDGKRPFRHADAFMAEIVAQHILDYLSDAGFVLMRKADAPEFSGPVW